MLRRLRRNSKGNLGSILLLSVLLFNIIMYIVIFSANADETMSEIGSGSSLEYNINATTNQDISTTSVRSWWSGFDVRIFGLPWYMSIFYVTFQGILLSVAIYSMVRGLS